MKRKKLLFVFGTRPEALKVAPLILKARQDKRFQTFVCLTAQHREMVDQVLKLFKIKPDFDLNLMRERQSLGDLTGRVLREIEPVLQKVKPDLVLVQGDTTTAFATALQAFYGKFKVGHIEAGLRSYNKHHPFPEEINRVAISGLADFHFAPTQEASRNLAREGIKKSCIFVTGNTVVDALKQMRPRLTDKFRLAIPALNLSKTSRMILVTAHRRENFGKPMKNICQALEILCKKFPDIHVVYPVHLNPKVRETVFASIKNIRAISLIPPQDYVRFTSLLAGCYLALTDSGGVQEEAPSFGKPVLVMRETTERPEGVKMGVARLVGTSTEKIVTEVSRLLSNPALYKKMATGKNPYGDGKASERILNILAKKL